MKKSLIAIALILLTLLFVSCNKESTDTSEEMVARYEKFCETYMMMSSTTGLFPDKTEPALKDIKISAANMKAFLSALNPGKEIEVTTAENELMFMGGIIKIEGDEKNSTATVPEATFVVSYKVGATETKNEAKYTIKLSSTKKTADKTTSVTFSLTINDKVYSSITYSFEGEKFTSATVDGKDVNVRLLNASRLNPSLSSSEKGTEETTDKGSSN